MIKNKISLLSLLRISLEAQNKQKVTCTKLMFHFCLLSTKKDC